MTSVSSAQANSTISPVKCNHACPEATILTLDSNSDFSTGCRSRIVPLNDDEVPQEVQGHQAPVRLATSMLWALISFRDPLL